MNKQHMLLLSCLAAFLWVDAPGIGNRAVPGYQMATTKGTRIKECPKGKHWDSRQAVCVKD